MKLKDLKKKLGLPSVPESQSDDGEGKRFNYRLFIISAAAIVVVFGFYRIVISLIESEKIGVIYYYAMMWTYAIFAGSFFIAVIVLNRGFSTKPYTADMLPDDWDYQKKREFLASDAKRRKISKILLIPCVAFILVFLFEIIEVYYLPMIESLLETLANA
ncbi:MAG: hypothetical protein LUH43_02580 [Clostridia bacterium]|nr:hypothetical protein [Clostridia bacterium]